MSFEAQSVVMQYTIYFIYKILPEINSIYGDTEPGYILPRSQHEALQVGCSSSGRAPGRPRYKLS